MTIEWEHYGRYSVISQLEQRNKTHLTHTERQAHERAVTKYTLRRISIAQHPMSIL